MLSEICQESKYFRFQFVSLLILKLLPGVATKSDETLDLGKNGVQLCIMNYLAPPLTYGSEFSADIVQSHSFVYL